MRAALVLCLVLLAGAAGCGGGDDDGGDGDRARAEYIERADAACRSAADDLEVSVDDLRRNPRPRALERAATVVDDLTEELRRLRPPPADRGTVSVFMNRLSRMATDLRVLADFVRSREEGPAAAAVDELRALAADATRIGRRYGFEDCARGVVELR